MANTKMTKRDYFNALLTLNEVKANQKYVEFINHELELLDRKNGTSGNRKSTAVQLKNEEIKEKILEVMEDNHLYTATEIMKLVQPYFADMELTNQKISALLRGLKDSGLVNKITDKRKTLFEKA